MNDLVYPIQKTPEGWYLNVHGKQSAYSAQLYPKGDEYYLDEVFHGTFGLHRIDGSEPHNADRLEIHCPHHPVKLLAKSNNTLVCLFCQAGK